MNKTIRGCAMGLAIVLFAGGSMAQEIVGERQWKAQDVVGEWRANTPQGELVIVLTMENDGKLAGTMAGGWWAGVNKLSEVGFVDGKLSVANVFEFNGEELTIWYDGDLNGNAIDGVLKTGDFGVFPLIVSRREPRPISVEGEWQVSFEGRQGTRNATLKITKDTYGKLAGTWATQRGESALLNLRVAGGVLLFTRHIEFNENSMDFNYTATVEGDSIVGTIASERFGERPFKGRRTSVASRTGVAYSTSSTSDASADFTMALGKWGFAMQTASGPREIQIELVEQDGQIAGTWAGPEGNAPIENATYYDGNLAFDINIDTSVGPFTLTFEAKVFKNSFYGKLITQTTRGGRSR